MKLKKKQVIGIILIVTAIILAEWITYSWLHSPDYSPSEEPIVTFKRINYVVGLVGSMAFFLFGAFQVDPD